MKKWIRKTRKCGISCERLRNLVMVEVGIDMGCFHYIITDQQAVLE